MRYIAAVLAVLVFSLAIFPCTDGDDCGSQQEEITQSDCQQNEDSEKKSCAPFCLCICCTIIGLEPEASGDDNDHFLSRLERSFTYKLPYSFDYHSRIFEPPTIT